jgi:hypothetical protein
MFPTIKEQLTDIQMVNDEDVFYWLRELLNEIPVRELRKVFDTWIKRLTAVTRGDGSYISWGIKLLSGSPTFNLEVQLGQRLIDQTISGLGNALGRGKRHFLDCTLNSKLNPEIGELVSPSWAFDMVPDHREISALIAHLRAREGMITV